jgi:predicted ATPase
VDELRDFYDRLSVAGSDALSNAIAFLKCVDPEILDVRLARVGADWELSALYKDRRLLMSSAGDGQKRLLALAATLAGPSPVLIEEPELCQHPGTLRRIARLLWEAVGVGKQVIASTHSADLIDLVHTMRPADDALSVLWLQRGGDGTLNAADVTEDYRTRIRLGELSE